MIAKVIQSVSRIDTKWAGRIVVMRRRGVKFLILTIDQRHTLWTTTRTYGDDAAYLAARGKIKHVARWNKAANKERHNDEPRKAKA